jgi:hypothetical protein
MKLGVVVFSEPTSPETLETISRVLEKKRAFRQSRAEERLATEIDDTFQAIEREGPLVPHLSRKENRIALRALRFVRGNPELLVNVNVTEQLQGEGISTFETTRNFAAATRAQELIVQEEDRMSDLLRDTGRAMTRLTGVVTV